MLALDKILVRILVKVSCARHVLYFPLIHVSQHIPTLMSLQETSKQLYDKIDSVMQLIESLQSQIEMQQDQTNEAIEQTAQPDLDKQLE